MITKTVFPMNSHQGSCFALSFIVRKSKFGDYFINFNWIVSINFMQAFITLIFFTYILITLFTDWSLPSISTTTREWSLTVSAPSFVLTGVVSTFIDIWKSKLTVSNCFWRRQIMRSVVSVYIIANSFVFLFHFYNPLKLEISFRQIKRYFLTDEYRVLISCHVI